MTLRRSCCSAVNFLRRYVFHCSGHCRPVKESHGAFWRMGYVGITGCLYRGRQQFWGRKCHRTLNRGGCAVNCLVEGKLRVIGRLEVSCFVHCRKVIGGEPRKGLCSRNNVLVWGWSSLVVIPQHISIISTVIIDITCDINSCDPVWVLRSSLTVAMYLQIGVGGV